MIEKERNDKAKGLSWFKINFFTFMTWILEDFSFFEFDPNCSLDSKTESANAWFSGK